MRTRGKREARRPWLKEDSEESTESAKYQRYLFRSFRASKDHLLYPGRRAALWLSYFAPLALGNLRVMVQDAGGSDNPTLFMSILNRESE
jgi:hypothetical protein